MKSKTLLAMSLALGLFLPLAAQAYQSFDLHVNNNEPISPKIQATDINGGEAFTRKQASLDILPEDAQVILQLHNNTNEMQHFKIPAIGIDHPLDPHSVSSIHLNTMQLTNSTQYMFENNQGKSALSGNIVPYNSSTNRYPFGKEQ